MKNVKPIAYFIILYVMAFFLWWSYLLIRTHEEKAVLQEQVEILHQNADVDTVILSESDINRDRIMIILEGVVFLLLLLLASVFVIRSISNREKFINSKKNFLLSTAHELRSPLASVKLHLQTMKRPGLGEDQYEKLLSNALLEVERLSLLTEKTLLASGLEEGKLQTQLDFIDFSAYISAELDSKYENENRIKRSIQPNLQGVTSKDALSIILSNLVDNGLKYSDKDVLVALALRNDKVELSVSDSGPGIPEAERKLIWDMFYRRGDEMERSAKGTGLGLYLVKSMAKLSNAKVYIEDNTDGGAKFVVTFPISST